MSITKQQILAWLEMAGSAAASGGIAYGMAYFADGIPSGFAWRAFLTGLVTAAVVAVRNRFATPPTTAALSAKATASVLTGAAK